MPGMDTLQAYEVLKTKGGFSEAAAKAVVEAVSSLVIPSVADLATKADLRAEIQAVKAELHAEIQAVKAELHRELHAIKVDLIKWMVSLVLAQLAASVGLIKLLV